MKITILAAGHLKESYWRQAVQEYAKRLGAYTKLEIIEVDDEKNPEHAGAAMQQQIMDKEAARMLAKCPQDAYVIAMAIEGREFDSEALAGHIEKLAATGHSHIVFIIGGSLGLAQKILQRADEKMSFSKLTFPHQMMRVILLEQIYRSFKIIKNEPYHK